MMRPLEALVFLSLAAGLHVGVWSMAPRLQGADSEGAPGQAPLTLAAAASPQAALARAWQTAPDLVQRSARPMPLAETPLPARPDTTPDDRPLPAAPPGLSPILPATPPRSQAAPIRAAPAPAPQSPDAPSADLGTGLAAAAPRVAPRRSQPGRPDRAAPDAPATADLTAPPPPGPAPQLRQVRTGPASADAPASPAPGGGAAGRKQTGRGGKDTTRSADTAARSALQAGWGAQIQRKVHRQLIYPRGASGSGDARVALTVDRAGRLTGLRLTRSSGVAAFDAAALNAVRRAGRFPAAPTELSDASYRFSLSLAFRP